MAVRFLLKSNLKSFTTQTRTPTYFPPPHPLLFAPTTTTTTTTTPPLKSWLAPPTPLPPRHQLLLEPEEDPNEQLKPFFTSGKKHAFAYGVNDHLDCWWKRLEVNPREHIKKFKNISDVLSWINLQSFPPTVKVVVHTICKGMLLPLVKKCFELFITVFFWLKEKLVTWWKWNKKANDEDED